MHGTQRKESNMERLDKLIANRTGYSRSDVKLLLKKGAVRVDGIAERDGSRHVDPSAHRISCEGKALPGGEHVYYIMNKPAGVICATEDRTHQTVLDLLPKELRTKGLFPAGRLDADSTGLLLLTDDGALAHRMLSPKHHVPKCYLIRLARAYEADYAQRLAEGLVLADGTKCLPAEIMHPEIAGNYAIICLHEGKYHQVKRMLAALGNHVERLHRVAAGGLVLPAELASGGCLEMLHKDVEKMLNAESFGSLCSCIMTNFSSYSINDSL